MHFKKGEDDQMKWSIRMRPERRSPRNIDANRQCFRLLLHVSIFYQSSILLVFIDVRVIQSLSRSILTDAGTLISRSSSSLKFRGKLILNHVKVVFD